MRDECKGIPWADDRACERVSNGIEWFEERGYDGWASRIIVMADVDGWFEVDEPGRGPHDAVCKAPSPLGHAGDVFLGFTAPVYPDRPIGYGRDGEYDAEHITRIWLEAARVHVLRPVP